MKHEDVPARTYTEGIGEAVANRSINRDIVAEEGSATKEAWADVAHRVATGSAMLAKGLGQDFNQAYKPLVRAISSATLLMSGRHLQHGDEDQTDRNMEVFTNCSTAAMSSLSFYLLLNGSGVGRSYDDAMMAVDWSNMPIIVNVIDQGHADVLSGEIKAQDKRGALHLYRDAEKVFFTVPDSREGWAKAIEVAEAMAYRSERDKVLFLDYSEIRCKGSPIGGMQDRPASGPGPMMEAMDNCSRVRDANMSAWMAAMYVDHYTAECVRVGGARRAARIAVKTWTDKGIFDFICIKRPIEFDGMAGEEIEELRKNGFFLGFLWSANNSVAVDDRFWRYVKEGCFDGNEELYQHALRVLNLVTKCAYYDGTGEPGLINQDKLQAIAPTDDWADSPLYQLDESTKPLAKDLAVRFNCSEYQYIVNPCGEIVLSKLGGYCVIADVVPYHAANQEEAENAFRAAAQACIRVNTMPALYQNEVARTNRIGISLTGIHEWAWKGFGFGWRDLVDEAKSQSFWNMLSHYKRIVDEESETYSASLGLEVPHTNTTIKPAGTTSKLFGLSEGAHLPSMREYLRWVQFHDLDPLVAQYEAQGYPVRTLKTYSNTMIVGFPTQPEICTLDMGDKLVTASEATPEEQYEWLRLLEKYWIVGVDGKGEQLTSETGNQVSYTLKYDPKTVSFEEFRDTLVEGQSSIRCCSVMPMEEGSAYEYQPEEQVTPERFQELLANITRDSSIQEDIGLEHLECENGACPIDFKSSK